MFSSAIYMDDLEVMGLFNCSSDVIFFAAFCNG